MTICVKQVYKDDDKMSFKSVLKILFLASLLSIIMNK